MLNHHQLWKVKQMVKYVQRGRPIDEHKQSQQKQKLLDAAQILLAKKSFGSLTIRELADTAKVNSAMISYYFNNKEGLFIALIDEMSNKLFDNLQLVSRAENPIHSFITMMIKMLSSNKSFARLIQDEVLSNESHFKTIFIERFPKKMAKLLPQLIINNTNITETKKAQYAAFLLMMMIITPFTHEAVRQDAWGISDQEIKSPLWINHLYGLFINGCNDSINNANPLPSETS